MLNFLSNLIKTVLDVVGLLKKKAKATDVIFYLLTTLPQVVQQAIEYGEVDSAEKLKQALVTFDEQFGAEVGARRLLPTMPPEVEEETLDAVIVIVKNIALNRMKKEGYYIAPVA